MAGQRPGAFGNESPVVAVFGDGTDEGMAKIGSDAFLRRSNSTSLIACFPVRHSRTHDPFANSPEPKCFARKFQD